MPETKKKSSSASKSSSKSTASRTRAGKTTVKKRKAKPKPPPSFPEFSAKLRAEDEPSPSKVRDGVEYTVTPNRVLAIPLKPSKRDTQVKDRREEKYDWREDTELVS